MTDTTAPSYVRTIAETSVKIVAEHWGKFLGGLLIALSSYAMGHILPVLEKKTAPAPKVEIVRTVPAGLESRVSELAETLKRVEAKVDDLKPKARTKKK